MKKILIALMILLGIVLVGCVSDQAAPETTANIVEPTEEININGYSSYDPFQDEEGVQATSATEPVATDAETETAPEETKAAEVTEATEATEDGTGSTESTAPAETTEPTSSESSGEEVVGTTAYEQYNAMSAKQQEEFVNSFDSITDFIAWYNAAKAEYEALHPDIDVGDGTIDLGEIAGGNG